MSHLATMSVVRMVEVYQAMEVNKCSFDRLAGWMI